MAYVAMAYLVMACDAPGHCYIDLYGYGLCSYGLYSYGLRSYGLYSYGLYSNGLYSYRAPFWDQAKKLWPM